MKLPSRQYPAKVILYGEYTVLIGGDILAVPYDQFFASWQLRVGAVDSRLVDYLEYLRGQEIPSISIHKVNELQSLVERGAYLESNIKTGSGLGSSGSVVAAIYDICKVSNKIDASVLLQTFAQMESYFHGNSSGIDPLVSYTRSVVHKAGHMVQLYQDICLPSFELHDSEIARDTKKLVARFKSRIESDLIFASEINEMQRINTSLIRSLLIGDLSESDIKALSKLQLHTMSEYIPNQVRNQWMSDPAHIWKICGAGGGGYFLKFVSSQ